MGLKRRQKYNLKALLALPARVRQAIDDPDDHFGATHGIALGQLAKKYPQLDVQRWVDAVNQQRLSVLRMKRAINMAHRPPGPEPLGSICNPTDTEKQGGVFRFRAVKVVVAELGEEDREQLRD